MKKILGAANKAFAEMGSGHKESLKNGALKFDDGRRTINCVPE
ncbi:hypothetical protein [Arthrobacter sp. Leaf137]|nr:hypothetical protein [Arthrobacter sp. Leaf137]